MKHFKIYCLLFLAIFSLQTSAQDAGRAGEVFDQAKTLYDSGEYQQAYSRYAEAIKIKTATGADDPLFLAKAHHGKALAAWMQFDAEGIKTAHEEFRTAFVLATKAKDASFAGTILYEWSSLDKYFRRYDVKLDREFEDETEKAFFPVLEIIEDRGDTLKVKVGGGLNHGIYKGSAGGVLTAFTEPEERGNEVIGSITVLEVSNNTCIVQFVPNEEGVEKGLKIQVKDNVQIRRNTVKGQYRNLLHDLMNLNVTFCRSKVVGIITQDIILELTSYEQERILIEVLTMQAKETADGLIRNHDTTPVLNKPLHLARFGTASLLQAMSASTAADGAAFLRFVAAYPARYMGVNEKFDEKYAQWLLNEMLPGKPEKNYITESIIQEKDFESWLIDNAFYLKSDSSLIKEGLTQIQVNNQSEQSTEAFRLGHRYLKAAKELKLHTELVELYYELGMTKYYMLKHEEAIKYFDTAISIDSTHANSFWQRGNLYLVLENSKQAVLDFETVIRFYPSYASGHGNIGWEYFKQGKFKKAKKYIIKAYELDSFEPAWSINRGHLAVVLEDGTNAMHFYTNALENVNDASRFASGIIADFDLFKENGWSESEFDVLRAKVQQEFDEHYQYKIGSKQALNEGEDALDNLEFQKAFDLFYKALELEKKGRSTEYSRIRMAYRWIAFTHYKKKEYRKSIEFYKKGWSVARKELKSLDRELEDLTAIDNVYSYLDRKQERDMYQEFKAAVQRKINLSKRSRTMYLITVAKNNDDLQGYEFAESDAQKFHKRIVDNAELLFDSLVQYSFVGENIEKNAFGTAMLDIMTAAESKDVFLFYYAGNMINDSFILNKDLKLDVGELSRGILQIQAGEQMIILDAPYADFAGRIKDLEGVSTKNRLVVESAGSRLEKPGEKGSYMANTLLKALREDVGSNNSGIVSAKGLEHFLIREYQKEQLAINTHFNGIDFDVFRNLDVVSTADNTAPMIEVTGLTLARGSRGARVKNTGDDRASIVGKAFDASGIRSVSVDGYEASLAKNGKFELKNFVPLNDVAVVVKTEDNNGNIAIDTFLFGSHLASGDQVFRKGAGVNYALLVGTDKYDGDHWADLSNPIADVEEIGRILKEQYGFKVEIVKNPSKTQFQKKIYEYMRKDFEKQDQLFVFVAGHGMYDPSFGGHIVCRDSRHPEKDPETYLPYWFLTSNLNAMEKCNNVFLSLDVCFGGGFFDKQDVQEYKGSRTYVDQSKFIRDRKEAKTRIFLTSGSLEYVPDGTPGNHSPFAQMFIEALESRGGKKNYLTLADISNYMQRLSTKPRYGKFGENELGGDFIFEPLQEPISLPIAMGSR